jgi:tetratricopeptide (TPR) repeat protein
MRWLLGGSFLLVLFVAAAVAQGNPMAAAAKRKLPTDKYTAEAIEPFVAAIMADKAGDFYNAERRYKDSIKALDHANTHYNLADVQRRMERWTDAIKSYKEYLRLAPDAPDRGEVERVIAAIEQRPSTSVIDGEDPDGIVFIDGKLIGPSPVVISLPDGPHVIDRITPTKHAHRSFTARPSTKERHRMTASRETPGNVILSSNLTSLGSWRDNGNEYRLPGRMALPAGRHSTYLLSPKRACSPLVFDAPRPDELVFVYIEATTGGSGCTPIKVTQTKVRFPP